MSMISQKTQKDYFSSWPDAKDLEKLEHTGTFPEFLRFLQKSYAQYPALSNENGQITYAELVARVARRVSLLREKGFPAGANIAVLAPNDQNAMELLLAIPAAGFTVVMLPCTMPEEGLCAAAQKFDVAAIFAAEEFFATAEKTGVPVWPAGAIGDEEAAFTETDRNTPAAIYLTSGTTGRPKGVVLSHGTLMLSAYNGSYLPGHILNRSTIAMLPLTHIFGTVCGFLACLYSGSLIHICTDLKRALRAIPRLRPTMLALIPGMVELVFDIASMRGREYLGDLELVTCGAAPLALKQIERCRSFGVTVCTGYGLTECCPAFGNAEPHRYSDVVGTAYPGVEAKLVNGEVWLRGEAVMQGYYNEPEETARAFSGEWFRTGDLGEFREYDGYTYLSITGRLKNLIILRNGENVSPEELEALLCLHDEVQDCLVRVMDAGGNEVIGVEILPCTKVLAGASAEETEERLRAVIREVNFELPSFKQIRKLIVRQEDFARSASMKIIRG